LPKVAANGVELFYEATGDPRAPALILIMGLGTQMIAWPDDFVSGLAAAGFYVVRYDNRDVGLSTHFDEAKTPSPAWVMLASRLGLKVRVPYKLRDMADDAVALIDALGIDKAHVAGASMGGMIAQLVAAEHPERVLSLTSIMSSSGAPGLPGPTPELRRRLLAKRPPNPSREDAIKAGAETLKLISYPDPRRPATAFSEAAARAFDRAFDPSGLRRQLVAILADGSRAERLAKVRAPTLVIHGAADPLVPLACSRDIAARVRGSRLEIIDEMAHDLPPSQTQRMVDLIAGHAQRAT
jgi:proline iminopeptidase